MKWFKHYSSLHRQPESQATIRKLGYEWYGRYVALLEMCAEHYDGEKSSTSITLLVDHLKTTFRVVGDQWQTSLRLVGEYQGFTFEVVGEFIKVEIPILAEIHHKDSVSSKARRASLPLRAGRDKIRLEEKKNNININGQSKALTVSDLEIIYKEYPRKIKKSEGLKKLRSQLKTADDISTCLSAVRRFGDHVVKNKIETQYIPYFSTWVTSWRDWLDPETGTCSIKKPKNAAEEWLEEVTRGQCDQL